MILLKNQPLQKLMELHFSTYLACSNCLLRLLIPLRAAMMVRQTQFYGLPGDPRQTMKKFLQNTYTINLLGDHIEKINDL